MFFEYKKAKNMHKVNEKLHISGLLLIFDIEEKRPDCRITSSIEQSLYCATKDTAINANPCSHKPPLAQEPIVPVRTFNPLRS